MIVVTTPTGAIGHQVLEHLLGSNEKIRVIVRDPARIPAATRERIEIVVGSHGDPAIVQQAFKGADTVFWVAPPDFQTSSVDATYIDFTRPACDAIRSQGVRRVVAVSALGQGTELARNAGLVTASLAMDDLIAGTGVHFRALLLPGFMDNMLRQIAPIKNQGMFYSTISGDRKLPTCATRDIATVAAQLLLDPTWTGQGTVAVLGPEDLSHNEMAQILSEVLGKPIRYQQVPLDTYRAQLLEHGASEAMAQGMAEMMAAKDAGLDNAEPRTPESTTPTTFRQWCEEVLKPALVG